MSVQDPRTLVETCYVRSDVALTPVLTPVFLQYSRVPGSTAIAQLVNESDEGKAGRNIDFQGAVWN